MDRYSSFCEKICSLWTFDFWKLKNAASTLYHFEEYGILEVNHIYYYFVNEVNLIIIMIFLYYVEIRHFSLSVLRSCSKRVIILSLLLLIFIHLFSSKLIVKQSIFKKSIILRSSVLINCLSASTLYLKSYQLCNSWRNLSLTSKIVLFPYIA